MADVLETADRAWAPRGILAAAASPTSFWPVDWLTFAYFSFAVVLLAATWGRIAEGPLLLAFHVAAAALLIFQVKRPNRTSRIFRHWYPLPYVAVCYREMALLIPAIRNGSADAWLARLDFRVWHANPTVWLERLQTPWRVELLQGAYTLFVPAVLLVAFLLWKRGQFAEFRYYAFLIAFGFLASYVGYLLVPARGPRFLLKDLQHIPLEGKWLFQQMQTALDRLETAHYDCFPSGHTELTVLAWWSSRMVSRRLFVVYSVYTPFLVFATVYLRYHYTVDIIAGMVLAFMLIEATPVLFKRLS